ncbi:MAG TPA: hypothetical protein VGQ44_08765 [Gemmatimonadaceae bacterium]|jgi:hypothetical protein|nr:hypothetical protein [Gemmatimonadaceae bacterium]
MEHTHEFDCIVCGAHFDSQDDLARHDREQHEPRQASQADGNAEPIGNEQRRPDHENDSR